MIVVIGSHMVWSDGPSVEDVAVMAKGLDWPDGLPIVLCLRRKPQAEHCKPHLHRIQR
jgi:hypothetical protein